MNIYGLLNKVYLEGAFVLRFVGNCGASIPLPNGWFYENNSQLGFNILSFQVSFPSYISFFIPLNFIWKSPTENQVPALGQASTSNQTPRVFDILFLTKAKLVASPFANLTSSP